MESSKVPSRLLPILFGHALLQSTPGAQLPELPDELLVEILTQLDVSSLKKARLTCRRWGVAGARGLFRRVYFAPRKDLMSVFQAITGNPAFAVNITELDTTDPIDDMGFMTWSTKCYASSARYAWLLQEQSCIIYAKKDFDILCKGLARLPNLKRISVVDRYDGYVDYLPYIWTDSEWDFYGEWSAKFHIDSQWINFQHENFLPPSRWSDVASDDENTKPPWDFRGLEHLLKAALLHAPKLKELLMGCDLSNLSADLFTSEGSARALRKLAPRLTMLRADCTWNSLELNYGFETNIKKTLNKASRLEELYMALPSNLADWNAIIKKIKWPRLRVLNLGDGAMSLSALKAFSLSHTHTLRELRLRCIFLSGIEGWTDAAEDLGKILRLDFIALAFMADGTIDEELYIAREITESAICRFMQWVPRGQLRLASDGDNMGLAWHVNKFLPSPRLADFINADEDFRVETR